MTAIPQSLGSAADAASARSGNARSAPADETGPLADTASPFGELSIAIPTLGVTATFSPASMKLLADLPGQVADVLQDGGEALGAAASQTGKLLGSVIGDLGGSVANGADALADGLGEGLGAVGGKVADMAETLVGYGAAAALVGGAVLNELA